MTTFQSNSTQFTTFNHNKMILSKFVYTSQNIIGSISSKFYTHPIFNYFITINNTFSSKKSLPKEILIHIFKYIKQNSALNSITSSIKLYMATQLRYTINNWNISCINTNSNNCSHSYSVNKYNVLLLLQTIHLEKSKYILEKYYNTKSI